jgi:hypothetical protein
MTVYQPPPSERFQCEPRDAIANDYEPRRRAAILYRTHFWDATVEAEVLKLSRALADRYDIWVVGYVGPGMDFEVPEPIRKLIRTPRDLRVLGLSDRCGCRPAQIALRNLDNVLLYFFRLVPDYEHYWMIEYDVRYTGDWSALFDELDDPDVDLLGTRVFSRRDFPAWPHWDTLCTGSQQLSLAAQVKSFTPIMRVTRRAFEAIDRAYRQVCTAITRCCGRPRWRRRAFALKTSAASGRLPRPAARAGTTRAKSPCRTCRRPPSSTAR